MLKKALRGMAKGSQTDMSQRSQKKVMDEVQSQRGGNGVAGDVDWFGFLRFGRHARGFIKKPCRNDDILHVWMLSN